MFRRRSRLPNFARLKIDVGAAAFPSGDIYILLSIETVGPFRGGPVDMNPEKLKKLQAQVRIGGKGTPRRKKKVVHATAATDDKKLQSCLKKLSVNTIPAIEEVNMIKDDGTVIHFNNPKAQASLSANTFAITGHGENKQITDMLPGIISQLGPEGVTQLKRLASTVAGSAVGKATLEEDDEVPDLVENFDEASKEEVAPKKEADESDKVSDDKKEAAVTTDEKKEAPLATPEA